MTTVLMGGRRFSLDQLQAEPARFSQWFERARAETGYADCQCTPGRQLRLQIRLRDGLFHLAVWPFEGESHRSGICFFHKEPATASGRGDYAKGVIVDRDDGSSDIKVATPLSVRADERAPSVPRAPSSNDSKARRNAVGMLGLLHELWEGASLNRWGRGWSRNWSRCRWGLTGQSRRINGVHIGECLHVVQAWEPARKEQITAEFTAFRNRLGQRGVFRQRGFVVGELKEFKETDYGYRVDLRNQRDGYFASKALIDAVSNSSRAVMAARDNPNARTIVIMCVDRHAKGYLQVVDMALMLTNRHYIPCESSFEIQMADALEVAGRSFRKPLRYDSAEETFPDFELVDTDPRTLVEVWGMSHEAYNRRKAEKQAIYRAQKRNVIEWDARGPMPALALREGPA